MNHPSEAFRPVNFPNEAANLTEHGKLTPLRPPNGALVA